jgi:hypothetical protein
MSSAGPPRRKECDIVYRATDNGETVLIGDDGEPRPPRWTSPIHMPRRVSRRTPELSEVRVQRLQDISEEDAIHEGIRVSSDPTNIMFGEPPNTSRVTARGPYDELWSTLPYLTVHGPGSREANPFVGSCPYRVHQVNIDAFLKAKEAPAA